MRSGRGGERKRWAIGNLNVLMSVANWCYILLSGWHCQATIVGVEWCLLVNCDIPSIIINLEGELIFHSALTLHLDTPVSFHCEILYNPMFKPSVKGVKKRYSQGWMQDWVQGVFTSLWCVNILGSCLFVSHTFILSLAQPGPVGGKLLPLKLLVSFLWSPGKSNLKICSFNLL